MQVFIFIVLQVQFKDIVTRLRDGDCVEDIPSITEEVTVETIESFVEEMMSSPDLLKESHMLSISGMPIVCTGGLPCFTDN